MILWRIDAIADQDGDGDAGGWTQFVADELFANDLADERRQFGWLIDVYAEDVGGLTAETIAKLCGPLWPNMPLADLVVLAWSAKAAAKQQLDKILRSRK